MHHLPEHINQDLKGDKAKIRTSKDKENYVVISTCNLVRCVYDLTGNKALVGVKLNLRRGKEVGLIE